MARSARPRQEETRRNTRSSINTFKVDLGHDQTRRWNETECGEKLWVEIDGEKQLCRLCPRENPRRDFGSINLGQGLFHFEFFDRVEVYFHQWIFNRVTEYCRLGIFHRVKVY